MRYFLRDSFGGSHEVITKASDVASLSSCFYMDSLYVCYHHAHQRPTGQGPLDAAQRTSKTLQILCHSTIGEQRPLWIAGRMREDSTCNLHRVVYSRRAVTKQTVVLPFCVTQGFSTVEPRARGTRWKACGRAL